MKIADHVVPAGKWIKYDQKKETIVYKEEQNNNFMRITEWKTWMVKMLWSEMSIYALGSVSREIAWEDEIQHVSLLVNYGYVIGIVCAVQSNR